MPAWSRISCAYCTGDMREPGRPNSVSGVRPESTSIGMFSLAALMMPMTQLPRPTFTWTMIACGLPVAR
jgi:hypothetical protein